MTTIWLGIHEDNNLLSSAQGAFMQQEHADRWAAQHPRHRIYPVPLLATHRHYRGGEYAFVGDGTHTENLSSLAAYFGPDGLLWIRPRDMFHGQVPVGLSGLGLVPRFVLL